MCLKRLSHSSVQRLFTCNFADFGGKGDAYRAKRKPGITWLCEGEWLLEPMVGLEPTTCGLQMSCRVFGRVRGGPSVSEISDIGSLSVRWRSDAFAQVGVAVGVAVGVVISIR